jgi:tail lysozyme
MTPTVIKPLRLLVVITLMLSWLILPASQAHAITTDDQYCTLGSGNCTYFLQDDCDTTAGTDTPNVTLSGGDNIEKAFNFLVQNLHLTAIQAAAIVGNFEQESSLDPTNVNPSSGAYGIAQWLGSRLTELQGFSDNYSTLPAQLEFVQHELTVDRPSNLSDLKQTNDIVTATRVFENDYEKAGTTPDSPGVDIANRIAFAQAVLAKYGNDAAGDTAATPASNVGTDPDCASTASLTSAYGSQTTATALQLAWPSPACVQNANGEHRSSCADPTNAYRQAWDGASDFTDCGAFVATVMITSKADPQYPKVGTEEQAAYVTSHPSKYTIKHTTSTSGLSPGDILIYPGAGGDSGHTEIYVGAQPHGYVTADASLGDHSPQLNTVGDVAWILAQAGAFVAIPSSGATNTVVAD